MGRYLVVVDMQNDFVTGVLGSEEAKKIVPYVALKVANFSGDVIFTRDSHDEDYLASEEAKRLPICHCVRGSEGWEVVPELLPYLEGSAVIDKPSFGSLELADYLRKKHEESPIDEVEVIGVCTDICVVSNVILLKATLPEVRILVDAKGCAGTSTSNHEAALQVMRCCHVDVV